MFNVLKRPLGASSSFSLKRAAGTMVQRRNQSSVNQRRSLRMAHIRAKRTLLLPPLRPLLKLTRPLHEGLLAIAQHARELGPVRLQQQILHVLYSINVIINGEACN